MDRGWYAGPVGWMDATEDGEFCVALRSALLRDRTAHLYAGAGIVADSDPEAELAETELKLDAMLPLLSGLTRQASEALQASARATAALAASLRRRRSEAFEARLTGTSIRAVSAAASASSESFSTRL